MDELSFYINKATEINKKYAGKHIAIIGNKVVANGSSPLEVWKIAKKKYPKEIPTLAYAQKEDILM